VVSGYLDPVLLFEALLHNSHLTWRVLPREPKCLFRFVAEPCLELLVCQQDGHPFVVDGRHQLVGRGGDKGVDLDARPSSMFPGSAARCQGRRTLGARPSPAMRTSATWPV
jgi:hypothetical protein